MEKQPLYQQILDVLRTRIDSQQLKEGDRLPTEKELMKEFNVSRITASRAMRELEQMGMVYRRKGTGTFVEAQGRRDAATSPLSQSKLFAVLLPYGEHVGHEILSGAEHHARNAGYVIAYFNSRSDPKEEKRILLDLVRENYRGVLALPISAFENRGPYSQLHLAQIPLVFVDSRVEGVGAPVVHVDNFEGMYSLTKRLLIKGHRRIAFVTNSLRSFGSERARLRGYAAALQEYDIGLEDQYLLDRETLHAEAETGPLPRDEKALREFSDQVLDRVLALDEPPTCIMNVNDMTAVRVMHAAMRRGIRIPEDLSLTGFDNLSQSRDSPIALTTVDQKFGEIVGEAIRRLVAADQSRSMPANGEYVVMPNVIMRNSVRSL